MMNRRIKSVGVRIVLPRLFQLLGVFALLLPTAVHSDTLAPLVLPSSSAHASKVDSAHVSSEAPSIVPKPLTSGAAERARKLYDGGQYDKALSIYLAALSAEAEPSSALFYNVGCCYYRLRSVAPAILYFERAARLDPGDADTNQNLRLARAKAIDRIDEDALYERPLWHGLASSLGLPVSLGFGFLAAILLAVGVLMFFSGRIRRIRRIGFYLAFGALPVCLFFNLVAWHLYEQYRRTDTAIVMVLEAPVRSTPDGSGSALFLLHEGSKVRITGDGLGPWLPVTIGQDKDGWMRSDQLERVVVESRSERTLKTR